jgi:hypothetical protein
MSDNGLPTYDMRIKLGDLRAIIKASLTEAGGGVPFKAQPQQRNPMSPSTNSREQIGSMKQLDVDTELDDELPPHLRNPDEEPEDVFGPVPPNAPDPYVQADPFVRDSSVLPTPQTMRG